MQTIFTRINILTLLAAIFLLGSCFVQMAHCADYFRSLRTETDVSAWLYASSLEGSILVFTLFNLRSAAYGFACISCIINVLLYWKCFNSLQSAIGATVVSIALPGAIALYSHLSEKLFLNKELSEARAKKSK